MGEVNDKGFFARAFHPDDVDRLRAERQEGLLRGTPFEMEIRALFKSGNIAGSLISTTR